jgi:DNA sulfur modification protein DndB
MGSTTYYQATVKVSDLVARARPAKESDNWTTQSIEERMQRDPDMKRIEREIAPYLAKSPDRFFGSIMLLLEDGEATFESVADIAKNIPNAYRSEAQDLGFLTIDGGKHVVLDGQHRFLALKELTSGELRPTDDEEPWTELRALETDDVSVIFIVNENPVKTRRIFNRVNRYAKSTSRGDNIITSEDDGYAIVARRLLDEDAPLGPRNTKSGNFKDLVNWRSNTLSEKSAQFTTISVVYETVKLILTAEGVSKLNDSERPSQEKLDHYYELASRYWEAVLDGVDAYGMAMDNPSTIPTMRKADQPWSLLFKPAAQLTLFRGLIAAVKLGVPLDEAVRRANRIDWSSTADLWRDVLMRSGGKGVVIDASANAVERASRLVTYLIAGDRMSDPAVDKVRSEYNVSRGKDPNQPDKWEQLPAPMSDLVAA